MKIDARAQAGVGPGHCRWMRQHSIERHEIIRVNSIYSNLIVLALASLWQLCYAAWHDSPSVNQNTGLYYPHPTHGRKISWTKPEVLKLISIWSNKRIQAQLESCRCNQDVYEKISSELSEAGFSRTYQQCREKLKNLNMNTKGSRTKEIRLVKEGILNGTTLMQ